MVNKEISEIQLYQPIRMWLDRYLRDKFTNQEVVTIDSHSKNLDSVLRSQNIDCPMSVGIEIKIDILGITKTAKNYKLFFIEVKKTPLNIRDLGQLWAYCKLIDPEEAFLLTSSSLGSLNKILYTFKREDLLDYGEGKIIKKIKVGTWNVKTELPNYDTFIPKI